MLFYFLIFQFSYFIRYLFILYRGTFGLFFGSCDVNFFIAEEYVDFFVLRPDINELLGLALTLRLRLMLRLLLWWLFSLSTGSVSLAQIGYSFGLEKLCSNVFLAKFLQVFCVDFPIQSEKYSVCLLSAVLVV